jgi:hypothetical protein
MSALVGKYRVEYNTGSRITYVIVDTLPLARKKAAQLKRSGYGNVRIVRIADAATVS